MRKCHSKITETIQSISHLMHEITKRYNTHAQSECLAQRAASASLSIASKYTMIDTPPTDENNGATLVIN